jgi:hypothetical protein
MARVKKRPGRFVLLEFEGFVAFVGAAKAQGLLGDFQTGKGADKARHICLAGFPGLPESVDILLRCQEILLQTR